MAEVTIVHLRRGTFLTKQPYASWRELQDEYADYMASLGPYSTADLIEYLDVEYPTSPPFDRPAIEEFMADPSRTTLWAS
jgi:hypothetical protein